MICEMSETNGSRYAVKGVLRVGDLCLLPSGVRTESASRQSVIRRCHQELAARFADPETLKRSFARFVG
jgi:hypothetical protein